MREETITGESEECGRHKPTMETSINHMKQQEQRVSVNDHIYVATQEVV